MNQIFVSYSMNDHAEAIEALGQWRKLLEEPAELKDPRIWAASDGNVRDRIRERIAEADSVVVVWTQQAPKSPWVLYEIGMAHALGTPITVLLAGGERSAIPAEIGDAKIVEVES